jgi:hypothetical protein
MIKNNISLGFEMCYFLFVSLPTVTLKSQVNMTHKVDWLYRDQDDVSEWSNMSVYLRTGFFQWTL